MKTSFTHRKFGLFAEYKKFYSLDSVITVIFFSIIRYIIWSSPKRPHVLQKSNHYLEITAVGKFADFLGARIYVFIDPCVEIENRSYAEHLRCCTQTTALLFALKKPSPIFSTLFSIFWRFWYHKKAHVFLMTHGKFHSWKAFRWKILMKICVVMVTIIKLTQ